MQHDPQHSATAIAPAGLLRVFRPESLDLDDLAHAIHFLLTDIPARRRSPENIPEIDLPSRTHRGTYVMEARTSR